MKKISFLFLIISSLFSCTTLKNTPTTRTYHNVTAHYNVYFNGLMSYQNGITKIEEDYKYDYSQLLPIFSYSLDDAAQLANSDMNNTLAKMGKTISVHSITVKPKLKSNPSPKDRELMKKKEYCNWIDDAYLLIGKGNLYNREYQKSLRAFRRIINIYKTEDTRFEAELWIAKVYLQQEKYKDAFNYLTKIENDIRHPKTLNYEINMTFADYYVKKKDYTNAIARLLKALKLTHKKDNKTRILFILAQLEHLNKNDDKSADYLKKVIRKNPDYDMTFNAKIMRATVISKDKKTSDLKKQLRKMLKDEKNEDYKDKIYYALATISLKNSDTVEAIKFLKLSAQNSTINTNQKALSHLSLADIYFKRKDFLSAGKYYDSTMQYLSPKYADYKKISKRANNTGLLVKALSNVQIQDSLQHIAKMPEGARLKVIDKIIQDIIDEEKRQLLAQQQNNDNLYDPYDNMNNQNANNTQDGKWYMYNPILVSRGQNEFKRKWGTRKLEDNWRRTNKASTDLIDQNDNEDENVDSTKVTDKKTREYYLQNLPLTDSLMNISNISIENSLFLAAEVYQNMLSDYKSSAKTYEKLINRFPKSELKLEVYYRLYKLYSLLNNKQKENYYRDLLIIKFPDSKYAKAIQDPNFISNLIATQDQALNLYDKALQKYKSFDYYTSLELCKQGIAKYPESSAYPNFLFLKGKNYGSMGNNDSLNFYMNKVANKYSKTSIGILAGEIVTLINSGKLDYDIYKNTPNQKHLFFAIIPKKQNTTDFKFKLKYQAETFSNTKTFTIDSKTFEASSDIVSLIEFENRDEAMQFYRKIQSSNVFDKIDKADYNYFVISKTNLDIFIKDKIIDKYSLFFKKNY